MEKPSISLWKHQAKVMPRMMHPQAKAFGLFFDMATGKTRTALEFCRQQGYKRVLVVATRNCLVEQIWQKEMKRVAHELSKGESGHDGVFLPQSLVDSKKTVLRKAAELGETWDSFCQTGAYNMWVVLVHYDIVWREPLGDLLLNKIPWDCVILDEAHHIKAAGSKVSKFFARWSKSKKNSGAYRLGLTGTPLPNSPLDAYGLFRYLDPTIFGTRYDDFENRYAVMGGFNGYQVLRYRNLRDMQDKMQSISEYVRSEDAVELPDETHYTYTADLEPEAAKLYREIDKEFVAEFRGETIIADNVLTKMLRLQQLTSGHTATNVEEAGHYWGHKISLLKTILEDMPVKVDLSQDTGWVAKEPIVIFARFTVDIARIKQLCWDSNYVVGELSGRKNDLQSWHEGRLNCLVVQMQAGSEGIDLTRARVAIYYSKSLGLGIYRQSLYRIRRPNQKNSCVYIHLVMRNTVDEDIEKANAAKMDIIEYLLSVYRRKENSNV